MGVPMIAIGSNLQVAFEGNLSAYQTKFHLSLCRGIRLLRHLASFKVPQKPVPASIAACHP
jgi:hypothetical protein